MDGELSRLEDKVDAGLAELKATLVRIEEKLDARHEKLEDRVRTLETGVARVYALGALGTLIVGPVIGVIISKMVH